MASTSQVHVVAKCTVLQFDVLNKHTRSPQLSSLLACSRAGSDRNLQRHGGQMHIQRSDDLRTSFHPFPGRALCLPLHLHWHFYFGSLLSFSTTTPRESEWERGSEEWREGETDQEREKGEHQPEIENDSTATARVGVRVSTGGGSGGGEAASSVQMTSRVRPLPPGTPQIVS